MKDVFGDGLRAYLDGDLKATFTVESDVAETEEWDVATFFREWKDMSEAERIALKRCKGSVLDVGAGAGSHALWLQEKGVDVTALDLSCGAADVMRRRGVRSVVNADFFAYGGKHDTLLLLMNGVGIAGKMSRLAAFFVHARKLLNKGGRILLDSSDLIYLYEDEDGCAEIDLNGNYYGELEYTFAFKGEKGEPFGWLFVDYPNLEFCAKANGFSCKKIYEDDHFLYLAELTLENGTF